MAANSSSNAHRIWSLSVTHTQRYHATSRRYKYVHSSACQMWSSVTTVSYWARRAWMMWSTASRPASQCGLAALMMSWGCNHGLGSGAGQGGAVAGPRSSDSSPRASACSTCSAQLSGFGASGSADSDRSAPRGRTSASISRAVWTCCSGIGLRS